MRVLLIVGAATSMQGWGGPTTTRALHDALQSRGERVQLVHVESLDGLLRALDRHRFDIVWSGLYFASPTSSCFGAPEGEPWIPDVLDERGIPYVGSSAETLALANSKYATGRTLAAAGVPVPWQVSVPVGSPPPLVDLPAFVKPGFEAESVGIGGASVVDSADALRARVRYVHQTFGQAALVEQFLPGRELTISVVGNGSDALIRPLVNTLRRDAYARHPILCDEVKYDDGIEFSIPSDLGALLALARHVVEVLRPRDHTRIDAREDADGTLRVMELNGNPGLDPLKSHAARIHALYGEYLGVDGSYPDLVHWVLRSAARRHGLQA